MKKCLVIFCLLVLISGCNKKMDTVKTIIEENSTTLIAINYPKTNLKKLDQNIKKYINKIYNDFKTNYEKIDDIEKSELNIDYTYDIINDNYINITITSFISSSSLAHPITTIKTFTFDQQKKKMLNLEDIVDKNNLNKMVDIIKEELNSKYKDCILPDVVISPNYNNFPLFTFSPNALNIYFNPYEISSGYCGVINIEIPFSKISTKLNLKKENKEPKAQIVTKTSYVIDPNKPSIAITFDDGPSTYTSDILKLLKENDANATFFILGNKVNNYVDTLKEMYKNGNEIGNHSYNHKWLTKLSIEEFQNQINKTQDIIKNTIGYTPTLLRPTYGSVNKKIRANTDMNIVLWDVDTMDWKIKNSKKIASRALEQIEDLDIILMHDTHKRTLEALKIMIPTLKEKGYQLVTVSELKEIKLLRGKLES